MKEMTFPALAVRFDWTNETWARTNLPHVRIATMLVQRDDIQLTETISRMTETGIVNEMLDAALLRSFVALERLGFSPDAPPQVQNGSSAVRT